MLRLGRRTKLGNIHAIRKRSIPEQPPKYENVISAIVSIIIRKAGAFTNVVHE